MANTYSQLYVQIVFAVKARKGLVHPSWKDDLYKYITGIIQNHKHKVIQINGMPDHIHILIGLNPTQALSDLVRFVKGDSSYWINQRGLVDGKFAWQKGYGAFSYHQSMMPTIAKYIENQEKHHAKKTFLAEYVCFLKAYGIEYDNRYLFKRPT